MGNLMKDICDKLSIRRKVKDPARRRRRRLFFCFSVYGEETVSALKRHSMKFHKDHNLRDVADKE